MSETQIVSIPFTGALDTKSAWPQVNAANFLELENVVFDKVGALKKRWGYTALSTVIEGGTTRLGQLYGGAATPKEVVAFTNDRAYAYMPETDRWIERGSMTSVAASTASVSMPVLPEAHAADVASIGGIFVTVWTTYKAGDSGDYHVEMAVTDADGRKYWETTLVEYMANPSPKVIVHNGMFYVMWLEGTEVRYSVIDPENPTSFSAGPVAIVGDVAASGRWDAMPIGDYVFVAYGGDDGVNTGCFLRRFSVSGATATEEDTPFAQYPKVDGSSAAVKSVAIVTDHDRRIWVIRSADDTVEDYVRVARHDYSFYSATATDVDYGLPLDSVLRVTGYVKDGEDTLNVLIGMVDDTLTKGPIPTPVIRTSSMTYAGVAGTAAELKRGLALHSRPIVRDGIAYATFTYGSQFGDDALQPTIFLFDLDNARFAGKFASGVFGNSTYEPYVTRCCEWASGGDGVFVVPHTQRSRLTSSGIQLVVAHSSLDFASYRRYESAYLDELVVTGGLLQAHDGYRWTEHTPLLFPEGGTAVATGAGSGSLTAGTYQYKMVYEVTDYSGKVRWSAASQAIDVTLATADTVDITFPVLHVASDTTRVSLVLYRTKVNEDVFFRLFGAAEASDYALVQDTTVDHVSFTDNIADADIESNEVLYTTGGYLENINPPIAKYIVAHKGRLFLAGTPEPNRIWFSKLVAPLVAAGFNDQLTVDVDPEGGPITALGYIDDKLIVFKHSRCYYIQGNGPDDAGQGFDFYPSLVSSEVGCIDPGSVVTIPGGLLFKSVKGIYSISSGLAVQYVGAPVEAYNGQTIISATHIPDKNAVMFVCQEGRALVFDYLLGKWTTFTNHESVWCGVDTATNRLVLFRSNGKIHKQSDTLFTDAGNPVKMRVVTGWLAQSDLLGWQRVQRMAILGEYKGSHNLRVRFGYDFLPPYTQEATVPVSTLITTSPYGAGTYGAVSPYGGSYPAERFAIQLKKQKCLALRVCIEDVQSSGEALTLSGIAFRVAAKAGFNKQAQSRKIGAA